MKYWENVKTTLNIFLSIAADVLLIIGFVFMFGSVGNLDYSIAIGSVTDPAPDYRRLLLGTLFVLIGGTIVLWRQRKDEQREISTQKWIRKLTLQAWINEHSYPSHMGKHENKVL